MGYQIIITGMTLSSYIKVILRVTFHDCAFISAILGRIVIVMSDGYDISGV